MKKSISYSVQVIFWVLILFPYSYAFEWMQMAEMNGPRASFAAALSEGKIYVMGGSNGQYGVYLPTAEVYDPVANQWSVLPNMNSNRTYGMAQPFGGKVYIFGGKTAGGGATASVEEYDPITNEWHYKSPLPFTRWVRAAVSLNGEIYIIGGETYGGMLSTRVHRLCRGI